MDSDTKSLWNFSEAYLTFQIFCQEHYQTVVLNENQSHRLDLTMLQKTLGIQFNI